MAKRDRRTTPLTIEKRLREGRGKGEGAAYKPWLQIQDVPSWGTTSREYGHTTGREHHVFSRGELLLFYILDWATNVVDIREQYPTLPLERSQAMATRLGLKHPTDPDTGELVVITTDFLVTVADANGRRSLRARSYKPLEGVNARAVEKLRIESALYAEDGIDWGLVTDGDLPHPLVENLELLHGAVERRPDLDDAAVDNVAQAVWESLNDSWRPARVELRRCDRALGVKAGTSLWVLCHMLATRRWSTDLTRRPLREFPDPLKLSRNGLTDGAEGAVV